MVDYTALGSRTLGVVCPGASDVTGSTVPSCSRFRRNVGKLYTGLLAAGREADAEALAAEAIKPDDTAAMRVILVETAVHAGQAQQRQSKWLNEAAELRGALDAMG